MGEDAVSGFVSEARMRRGGDRWHWQARNCPFCIGQRIYLIKVATVDHLSAVMLLPVFGLILYGF